MLVDSVEDLRYSPLLPILDGTTTSSCSSDNVKLSLILPMLPFATIASYSFELFEQFVSFLRWS